MPFKSHTFDREEIAFSSVGLNRALMSILGDLEGYCNIAPSRVETFKLLRKWPKIGEQIWPISTMFPGLFFRRDSCLVFQSHLHIQPSGEDDYLGGDKESWLPADRASSQDTTRVISCF